MKLWADILLISHLTYFWTRVSGLKDVIVVGAGVSGAAAARTLHNSGQFRVTVLEAQPDRLGGRIYTDRSVKRAQGPECELGSPYLQCSRTNSELSQVIDKLELVTHSINSLELIKDGTSVLQSTEEFYRILRSRIIETLNDDKIRQSKTSISLYDVLNAMEPLSLSNNLTVPFSTLRTSIIEPMFGTSATYMSATNFQTARLSSPTHISEGVDELVNRLIGGTHRESTLDVDLGKVVRQIKIDTSTRKVKVRTVDRKSFVADAVVVTLPLGVLQDNSVHFEPRLPPAKLAAIKKMGCGQINTVIVEFNRVFWTQETGLFINISPGNTTVFPLWINCYPVTNKPVLISHTYGEKAMELEKLDDKQLEHMVLESLSTLFPPGRVEQASVISLTRSRWKDNKYAGCSLSFVPIDMSIKERRELSHPIRPYLYFAGEHTSLDNWGTVEGAYTSGVEAAESLIKDLLQSEKPDL